MNLKEIIITNEPLKNDYTSEEKILIKELHQEAFKGYKSTIKKLKNAIEKYPHIPSFKNYLFTLYQKRGEKDKCYEIALQTIKEHPDYLFGKLTLAVYYLENGAINNVKEILGENLFLADLAPHRDVFHYTEFVSFYSLAIKYLLDIKNFDRVEEIIKEIKDVMKNLPEDDKWLARFEQELMINKIEERQKRDQEIRDTLPFVTEFRVTNGNKKKPPVFHHPKEMKLLYNYYDEIELSTLKSILSLPEITLKQDLYSSLEDSILRFNHFKASEFQANHVINSVNILAEIDAENFKDVLLNLLKQSDEFYDVYFGYETTDWLYEACYKVFKDDLEIVKEYLMETKLDTFARLAMIKGIACIVFENPIRKKYVLQLFKEVLHFYATTEEDHIVDSSLNAMFIEIVMDLEMDDCFHEIIKLNEAERVDPAYLGDFQQYLANLDPLADKSYKYEVRSLIKKYEMFQEESKFQPETFEEEEILKSFEEYKNSIIKNSSEIKVGRNDPCPCGSGKKYKKCCM
ncbi:SEC-C metal-binding domain-containing protein [Flammeovirga sp. MY04]|uniref:SEC-C metal-binding domain-containing protein n=1 Tax=Flammeovirga sp. MY04 TaxID=1191459 RepID=UPI0008061AAD|nr:SEC-C metal-binding domain-containing protein [Flammeovirga sp. MY04]